MSSVNYSLKNKGVRLISSDDAWVKGKNGKRKLNPKYAFVGKIDTKMPGVIMTASESRQPSFKGDFSDLNRTAKNQTVKHFFDTKGKRTKKTADHCFLCAMPQKLALHALAKQKANAIDQYRFSGASFARQGSKSLLKINVQTPDNRNVLYMERQQHFVRSPFV